MNKERNGKTLILIVLAALAAVALIAAGIWLGFVKNNQNETSQQNPDWQDDAGENHAQDDAPTLNSYVDWGDDTGGRQTYSEEEIAEGVLGDEVVLNSQVTEWFGDTRQFVKVWRVIGVDEGGYEVELCQGPEIAVSEGIYLLSAYIQNDNPGTISENTRVGFGIPTSHGLCLRASGWVFSDNATTKEMWHEVTMVAKSIFHLEYVYGSARLWRDGFGDGEFVLLPDEIVTKLSSENGTQVGYDELNGELPGGEEYGVMVQIMVLVVYDDESKMVTEDA